MNVGYIRKLEITYNKKKLLSSTLSYFDMC